MARFFIPGLFGASRWSRVLKPSALYDDRPYPEGPAYSIFTRYQPVRRPEDRPVNKPAYRTEPVYRAQPCQRGFQPWPSQPTTSASPEYQEIWPGQQTTTLLYPEPRPQRQHTSSRPRRQEIRPVQGPAKSHCYEEEWPRQQVPLEHCHEIRPGGYNYGDNWKRNILWY